MCIRDRRSCDRQGRIAPGTVELQLRCCGEDVLLNDMANVYSIPPDAKLEGICTQCSEGKTDGPLDRGTD
eukprot:10262564-Alexandrium_andersonii.AAC.1